MPLPRQIIFNELSGDEIKHILQERFELLLSQVPYLQKHITLPRLKMTLQVHLDQWADQPNPERKTIHDELDISSVHAAMPEQEAVGIDLSDVVNASPKGGQRPDKIRDDHGLPIADPTRNAFSHEDNLTGRKTVMANGSLVDRSGRSEIRPDATVVVQDFGPAGLARQEFNNRPEVQRGGRDGGPVAPPVFNKADRD